MKIKVLSFTDRGEALAERLKSLLTGHETEVVQRGTPAAKVCEAAFRDKEALVFIGAAGIAVRSAAPFIRDKFTDPPLVVIDEAGRFVIPVLSGHLGGANELAQEIADALGAVPVITTATDVNESFAVDVFAKENGLRIANREGIARVSSSALKGRPVTICIKDYPPAEHTDVLISDEPDAGAPGGGALKDMASIVLCPKRYAIGMGCRRGKSFEELREFAERVLAENGIQIDEAGCVATIDIKKDEEGLRKLSQAWRMPLITFDAGILNRLEGDFSHSETVLEKVGTDNVCERAAVAAAGRGSRLVVKKTAENGMTAAVAEIKR
ncbi:MAG: cobalt-precorrin 5A hydrolase [Mogibacterium sp.]|nr:cobalt-precorrin 5A hydrolase [Mogibacterium sp.]